MRSVCVDRLDDLTQYRAAWDDLAGENIFRSWNWFSTWWKHYGDQHTAGRNRALRTILVFPNDRNDKRPTEGSKSEPIAILPCYLERSIGRGRVWRLCGDGEVCSDHLGLLSREKDPIPAADAVAQLLLARNDWDLLEFSAIDLDDEPTRALGRALNIRGGASAEVAGPQIWTVELPSTWDEYLMQLSKSHRKKIRRLLKRAADDGGIGWHKPTTEEEFDVAWAHFADLHQRRWESVGEPGCFASSSWSGFHGEVARKLFSEGDLRLGWLEQRGRPIAAEYQFARGDTTYAYQGGVEPEQLDGQAGRLSLTCAIQQSLSEGRRRFDFLRGDEPYKRHWRAEASPTVTLQVIPPRSTALWRCRAWEAAHQAGRLVKRLAGMFT